jgi:predicted peptidase
VSDVETKKKLFEYDKVKYKEFNASIMKDDGVHNITNEMKRL